MSGYGARGDRRRWQALKGAPNPTYGLRLGDGSAGVGGSNLVGILPRMGKNSLQPSRNADRSAAEFGAGRAAVVRIFQTTWSVGHEKEELAVSLIVKMSNFLVAGTLLLSGASTPAWSAPPSSYFIQVAGPISVPRGPAGRRMNTVRKRDDNWGNRPNRSDSTPAADRVAPIAGTASTLRTTIDGLNYDPGSRLPNSSRFPRQPSVNLPTAVQESREMLLGVGPIVVPRRPLSSLPKSIPDTPNYFVEQKDPVATRNQSSYDRLMNFPESGLTQSRPRPDTRPAAAEPHSPGRTATEGLSAFSRPWSTPGRPAKENIPKPQSVGSTYSDCSNFSYRDARPYTCRETGQSRNR
jgi:hypothetical protein